MIDSIAKENKKIWVVVMRDDNHVKSDDRDEKWRKMCWFSMEDDI
jgi:hypothetical protein